MTGNQSVSIQEVWHIQHGFMSQIHTHGIQCVKHILHAQPTPVRFPGVGKE